MMPWLLCGLGLVILLLAGDALVRGAVNLSLRIGIPALIVSLTIVAFGTSAPELLISISAILDNAPDIALGNVVGSNTANILLVLGIPALLAPLHTSECNTRKTYVLMLLASVLFILMQMACNAIVANCVREPLLRRSIARAVLLRHALEVQLMSSLFMYFPASFGWELRELLGLFVGSALLIVLGRDARKLSGLLSAEALATMALLFILEFHHCVLMCIFPSLYRTPGILNDAAGVSAAALGTSIMFIGTML